ncbi:MAG TPA: hydroxyphenylacetyl-CoA thioesterase PaaI [Woeseiaceae bacterium]|nr:hydroxyphenylacetyl-CoA thioesterase PaaI [Woeseiaceae bacterium]
MSQLDQAERSAAAMWARDTASQALGIAIEVLAPGEVRATMTVRPDMVNGHDVCHGGYLFTLADTAFAFACNAYGKVTVAAGAHIDFLRPVRAGERLTAHASERHRGRRTGIYDVVLQNAAGETVALFRGRSHVTERPLPGAGPPP